MQSRISRTFNGTGAALYLGLGFVPDWVKIHNIEDANFCELRYSVNSRVPGQVEGVLYTDGVPSALAYGAGVAPYRGGDYLPSGGTTVYLVEDPERDKRDAGILGTVNKWTLDTAANRTGHVDAGVNTTYVGVGSRMLIKPTNIPASAPIWVTVLAITNDGDAADELTLSEVVQSGDVLFISGMYDMIAAPSEAIMPAGIIINETGALNVSGEYCYIEAGIYGDE